MAAPTSLALTSSWQSLGPGPVLVRVLTGIAVFLSSATMPASTATGGTTIVAAVGDDASVVTTSAECWVKGVTNGTTINYLPLPATTASSASSSTPTSPDTVAVSQITLLQAIATALGTPAQDATVAAVISRLGSPAQDGADIASAAMPAGGSGIRGWLSASHAKLTAIANALAGTLAVSANTLPLPTGAATDATVAAVTAKLNAGVAVSNFPATQPVTLATAPLPPGAATDASLLAIKAAIQAQVDLATSVWTDGTSFYVRRESVNEGTGAITVAFTNPDGSPATAAAGLRPVASDNALALVQTLFDVTASGAGTAVGDVVAHVVVVNKAVTPPTASAALWLNLTQGTTLAAAPATGSTVEQTQHLAIASAPANLAQDASLQQIVTKLGALLAPTPAGTNNIGTVGPAPRAPVSFSTTTVAVASTPLWPANAARASWTIFAPQGADLWINPLGGPCGIGLVDCFRIPAGGYAKATAGAVETSAFTYFCATGGLVLSAYQL